MGETSGCRFVDFDEGDGEEGIAIRTEVKVVDRGIEALRRARRDF